MFRVVRYSPMLFSDLYNLKYAHTCGIDPEDEYLYLANPSTICHVLLDIIEGQRYPEVVGYIVGDLSKDGSVLYLRDWFWSTDEQGLCLISNWTWCSPAPRVICAVPTNIQHPGLFHGQSLLSEKGYVMVDGAYSWDNVK